MQKSHKRNKKHIFLHPLSRSSSLVHHKASNDDEKIYHCKHMKKKEMFRMVNQFSEWIITKRKSILIPVVFFLQLTLASIYSVTWKDVSTKSQQTKFDKFQYEWRVFLSIIFLCRVVFEINEFWTSLY